MNGYEAAVMAKDPRVSVAKTVGNIGQCHAELFKTLEQIADTVTRLESNLSMILVSRPETDCDRPATPRPPCSPLASDIREAVDRASRLLERVERLADAVDL